MSEKLPLADGEHTQFIEHSGIRAYGDVERARLVPAIPSRLENGEPTGLVQFHKPRSDGVVAIHFFSATVHVELTKTTYHVQVQVEEDERGNLSYPLHPAMPTIQR